MGNPTSIGIKGGADLNARIQELDQEQALQKVHELSVQLKGKSGVLQLVNADNASKDVRFERKSWWQFGSRSEANKTRTAEALKELVGRANLDTAKLDQYLAQRGGRAGTRTLSKVLSEMVATKQAQVVPPHSQLNNDPLQQDPANSSQQEAHQEGSGLSIPGSQLESNPQQVIQGPANHVPGPVFGSMDSQMNAALLEQSSGSQRARGLQVPPPAVATEVQVSPPAIANEVRAPAPAVPKPPLQTNAELHQAALDAVRRGQRAKAVELLGKIQGALTPQNLARFVVQDCLQGRPIATQMVLMAEAAYSGTSNGALKMTSFLLDGITLPHEGSLNDPQFDASHELSGLFDMVMLLQARQPDLSADLAGSLARRVERMFTLNESKDALVQRLRSAASSAPISVLRFGPRRIGEHEHILEDFDLEGIRPHHVEDLLSEFKDFLQAVQARHPDDESLGRQINHLRSKLEECERQGDEEIPSELKRTILKELRSIFNAEVSKGLSRLDEQLTAQAASVGFLSIEAKADSYKDLSAQLKAIATTTAKLGQSVQGSRFENSGLHQARNSNFDNCYEALDAAIKDGEHIDLQGCILNGSASHLQWSNANLAGSDLTFELHSYRGLARNGQEEFDDLRQVNFSNANLDGARIHINWKLVEDSVTTRRGPSSHARVEAFLNDLMNHLDHATRGSVLTMIASIDDRYADLKVGLMRDAMELLARERCIDALSPALVDVLSRSPVFLADARIRELSASFLPTLLGQLEQHHLPEFLRVLAPSVFDLTSMADQKDAQQALRSEISLVNAILRRVEDNPGAYDQATQDAAAQLRARVHDLPEIKPLLPTLDVIDLVYRRADGQTVSMPYYFDFGRDGAVAALDAVQYMSVAKADPAAKLVEDSIFFVPPSQRYGQVNDSDYPVSNSPLVMLAPGEIKGRGVDLLKQFPLLKKAYLAARSTPANALLNRIFAGPGAADTRQMFSDAFKGVARRLNTQEIQDFQTRHQGLILSLFTNAEEAGNYHANWPQLKLSDTLLQSLREQAELADVDTDTPNEFGHYLLTQSAVLTRLSSEKVFGDGENSVPSLRMLGYGLFKEALRVAPQLLDPEESLDMENRFLDRNGAMDCAEILSSLQLRASKRINPVAFGSLTPSVFQSLVP